MKKIRVLVVDDSALIRQVLSAIINAQPDMEVVGTAANPVLARDKLKSLAPDVLTLDIEMPLMSGLDFLEQLMVHHPLPVLMVSTLTERGSEQTLRALEAGAIDFISKPKLGVAEGLRLYAEEICTKLRGAAQARVVRRVRSGADAKARLTTQAGLGTARTAVLGAAGVEDTPPRPAPRLLRNTAAASSRVVVVGSSTGGTEAVRELLMQMPTDGPGILIAQHMPEHFTRSFAQRLDRITPLEVCEAEDGQPILPGHAYVAPGHSHLLLRKEGGQYVGRLSQADPVNRHRPSVDVLFHSAVQSAGADALGVILTGMGKDGAAGLLALRRAGARTIAQDEASCVVFGMPREAIALGAAEEVLPLDEIAPRLAHHFAHRH